jgi:integration host factor subunit beta
MPTITKRELIARVAKSTGDKRVEVKRTISAFLDVLIEELSRGNRIEFREFGVFECKERAARTAQNPRTLERVAVPPRRTVKFRPGRQLRNRMEESASVPQPRRASRRAPSRTSVEVELKPANAVA